MSTAEAYDHVLAQCRSIYIKKMKDYGPSWRIMRPQTVNDQLFIKAKRVRTLEMTGVNLVGEDIAGEMRAIVNYSVMGIIQLRHGYADSIDMTPEQVTELYDKYVAEAKALMLRKNHDYGEAWRADCLERQPDAHLRRCRRQLLRHAQLRGVLPNTYHA